MSDARRRRRPSTGSRRPPVGRAAGRNAAGRNAAGTNSADSAVAGRRPPGEPRRVGYLYLLPALLVSLGFVVWPLLHGAWLSLFDWDGETLGTWVGAANYVEAVADPKLRDGFGHALTLVFFYAVLPCCLALVLVAVMSRARPRGLGFFRTVLFLPQVIAMVAVAVVWRWIYATDGPINTVLRWLGLDSLTRGWLGDFTWALPSVGLVGTWVEVGLAMVLFLAGVQKIPTELYDAARVDGAGPVREFFAITLPGLRRELAVALTLTIAAALRNFDLIFMTTKGGPGDATRVPAYEVYHRVFETAEVGLACAIGIVIAVMILSMTVVITRLAEGSTR